MLQKLQKEKHLILFIVFATLFFIDLFCMFVFIPQFQNLVTSWKIAICIIFGLIFGYMFGYMVSLRLCDKRQTELINAMDNYYKHQLELAKYDKQMADDLEITNIMSNTNKNQCLKCPEWVVALLNTLDSQLSRVMWNKYQEKYESPFDNTANSFKNDVFEVQAYNWNDDVEQPYNFKWREVEISWYKHLGRDTTINGNYTDRVLIFMFNDCLKSILDMDIDLPSSI